MDGVGQNTGKGYYIDSAVIWISLAVMWLVLVFVVFNVIPLSNDGLVRIVIVGSAALAGIFATSALIAVLLHLRRNQNVLYEDAPPQEGAH
jgi:hypothetical protein